MSYDMDRNDVFRFADSRGMQVREHGDEIQFRFCPSCDGGQHHDEWTFSINGRTGAFKCLRSSCGYSGHFVELCRDFGFQLEFDQPTAYRQLKQPEGKIQTRPEAIDYLMKRGISRDVIERYEITARNDNPTVLVFPFRDDSGILRFVKYRNTKKGSRQKEFSETGAEPILFGMNHATDFSKPLIITEGQIDSLSLSTAGIPNAVSVPTGAKGFTWIRSCFDWCHLFPGIIIMGDNENGHITLYDDIRNRLGMQTRCVRKQDYLGEKDANDILLKFGPDALVTAIKLAELPKIQNVVDLSTVEPVNESDLARIKTNIRDLDRCIGGLIMGQLVIIQGVRGEGKSTLASQFCATALQQGHSIFAYSGELAAHHFRRILDFQLAGAEEILETRNEYNDPVYSLPKTVTDKLGRWYKGRAFLYDNDFTEDGQNTGIIETIEKVVKQFNVKLVLVDNLMSAMGEVMDRHEDLYTAQSRFVGKLKGIARKYDCCVLLVCHPRKVVAGHELTPDDVSGSGDITNQCDIILTYSRTKDGSSASGLLTVTKNRLYGKLILKDDAIRLGYSERTKRIYDDKDRTVKKENKSWKTEPEEVFDEELPF